jgi:hypothetical protein
MCLNWNVLLGLAVVALAVGVVAPHLFWSAIPTLLVLACPLSMLLMLLRMGKIGRVTPASSLRIPECPACDQEALPGQASQEEATTEQALTPRSR